MIRRASPELIEDICGACQGSGEGYCDNSICWACKGSGVVYRTPDGELADPDTNDEDPPTKDRDD